MRVERMIVGVVAALLATFAVQGTAVAGTDMTYNGGDPNMTYNCVIGPDMTYNCTEMTGH